MEEFFYSKEKAVENVTGTVKSGHLVSVNSYDQARVSPNNLKCETLEEKGLLQGHAERLVAQAHKKIPSS